MEVPCVTVIDDDPSVRNLLRDILEGEGARVILASGGDEGLSALRREPVDALFVDLKMPGRDGLSVIEEARRTYPNLPSVVITGHASLESSVEAMRSGATDYVTKPITAQKITHALARAVAAARRFKKAAETSLPHLPHSLASEPKLVYASASMVAVVGVATRVAPANVPVLLHGEAGVGKRLLANLIHAKSDRASASLIEVACAGLREELIERTFFGHEIEPGQPAQAGSLELAAGGTLLLSDVDLLPLWTQSLLWETFQRGWFTRQGGSQAVPFNARVIACTTANLAEMVEQGRFLRSLFYYLNVVPIEVPPLRQRREDIRPLATHFLSQLGKGRTHGEPVQTPHFSKEAWDCLLGYEWPGNVRELSNLVKRSALLAKGNEIDKSVMADLPSGSTPQAIDENSIVVPLAGDLRVIERYVIAEVIKRCRGNKAAAARVLGLHRKTLYRLLAPGRGAGDDAGSAVEKN